MLSTLVFGVVLAHGQESTMWARPLKSYPRIRCPEPPLARCVDPALARSAKPILLYSDAPEPCLQLHRPATLLADRAVMGVMHVIPHVFLSPVQVIAPQQPGLQASSQDRRIHSGAATRRRQTTRMHGRLTKLQTKKTNNLPQVHVKNNTTQCQ